jgi:hypothetical protein
MGSEHGRIFLRAFRPTLTFSYLSSNRFYDGDQHFALGK